jgi:hypothetical protein
VPDVKQTDARMAMLRLIDEGLIHRDVYSLEKRYEHRVSRLTLTVRTADVIDAKWAREENYDVVLTAKGRQVLAEYEKEQASG